MASYIIGYDLNTLGQDYSDLRDAIKSYGTWWHHLDSTWIITTDDSAVQIRDYLKQFMDANDELLVAELTGVGAWTGFNSKGSDWLLKNL
jgi:hypothetical protein